MDADDVLRRIGATRPKNTPALRRLRRVLSQELKRESGRAVIALAQELVRGGDSNGRWIGYELIQNHPQAEQSLTAADVERLGHGLCDWAGVDTFACYISGPAWREGRIDDARVHRWARSKDRWRRRAALVSTVPLNVPARGGHGDAPRTLALCKLLVKDRDDTVVKALSWALRALAAREPDAVSGFLAAQQTRLAALVKREVRNKLSTGLKNPRRKSARATVGGL
jgi:3-methyladenine DNA glycosylase AlkD